MANIVVSDNTGSTVGGTDDNELSGFSPTTQLGSGAQAYIDAWQGPDVFVTLIFRFPIPSGSGAVSNAKLRLYMTEKGGSKTALSVYEILRTDWSESQSTYNIFKTGNNWTSGGAQGAGSDRSSSAIATANVSGISTGNYVEFTGSGLTALIQDAIDNAKSAVNMVVQFTDLSFTSQNYVRFRTSEGTDGQRPELTYTLTSSDTSLAANANAIAAAAGALLTNISLAANAVGVSVANGQLTTQVRMSAASIAQAVSAAALSTGIRMDADAIMQAAAAGTLSTQIRMVANAAAVANANGSLGIQATLSANAVAQAAAAAGLTTQIRLNSQAQAQASASAGLAGTAATLSGAAVSIAVANGQLNTLIILDGDAITQAILAGGLTTAILLDADATAAVIAAGNLQVGVVLDWIDIPVISNVWYQKRTALVLLPSGNRLNLRKLH